MISSEYIMINLPAPFRNNVRRGVILTCMLCIFVCQNTYAAQFNAGAAQLEITPEKPMPMWGYGARHAALSQGKRDALFAKAVVIEAGLSKLALVSLDLGRSPTESMMTRIRESIKASVQIDTVMICGSHTHHGPVIELLDEPGKGKGPFDDAVAYASHLERSIIAVIEQAAREMRPARWGWSSKPVQMNRNRHSKRPNPPTDSELSVVRIDTRDGQPLAVLVNYAAHPTMLPAEQLTFSADWPGQMTQHVEQQLKVPCLFLQGAAGDMSTRSDDATRTIEEFGTAMGNHVIEVHQTISTSVPRRSRIDVREESFEVKTRMPMGNPVTMMMFSNAFFPELAAATLTEDLKHEVMRPQLIVVMINRELALVGGSGEFFCRHSLLLKERSKDVKTMFLGYCNGHHMYFPTIEAVAEGGYGADSAVSWVEIGTGERMMDRALIHIYEILGKL